MNTFQQRTIIGAIAIGIVSSGLTAWLMSGDKLNESNETSARYEQSYSEHVAPPSLQDPAMSEQYMQMQAQIAEMNKRLAQLTKDNAKQSDAAMVDNSDESILRKAQQHDAGQVMKEHVDHIANRFEMEETDAAWADNVSVEIQDAFLAEGIVGNSSLDNVDCRSSLCKLDVSFNDENDLAGVRNQLVEKVGQTLPFGAIQPGESDNQVTIYLGNQSDAFAPETAH